MVVVLPAPLPPSSAGDRAGLQARTRCRRPRGVGLVDLDQLVDGDGGFARSDLGLRQLSCRQTVTLGAAVRASARRDGAGKASTTLQLAPTIELHSGHVRPSRPGQPADRGATCASTRWCGCAGSRVIGQTSAVLVVYFGLDFDLPLWRLPCGHRALGLAQHRAAPALPARRSGSSRTAPPGCSPSTSRSSRCCCSSPAGCRTRSRSCSSGPVLLSATALPPRMTLLLGVLRVAVRDRCSSSCTAAALGRATTR